MKILKNLIRKNFLALLLVPLLLVVLMASYITTPPVVFAATTRIDLGTADVFAILAGAAVTGTGANSVTGHVGLSPTGGTAITALTCAEVTGTIYDTNGGYTGGGGVGTACLVTNPGLLTTAKSDLSTAYNDAFGRTPSPDIATDLAGATLTSGVYKSAAGTFSITGGGTVTLNGEGNADAVFIFQMASTLITSTSSKVVLTNSAQECNVYWQVGSSATIGDSSTMRGNVMAATTITANAGSTVYGRLLADANNADADSTGAVTILDGTTITKQTCAAGSIGAPASIATGLTKASGTGGTAAAVCPPLASTIVAPFVIESRRISPTSIFLSWGPQSGTDKFNIQYGFEHGKWLYNIDVTGFSTTINNLPPNKQIFVQIAARNDCRIGGYGVSKLIGGPKLPNTGLAPHDNDIPWSIPAALLGISGLVILIQRKYRTSFKS